MKNSAPVLSLSHERELARDEAQLAHAEAQLSGLEARQQEAAEQAAVQAAKLAQRVTSLHAELAKLQLSHEAGALPARLQGLALTPPSLAALRQQALRARMDAVEARQRASHDAEAALRGFQEALARVTGEAEALQADVARAREHARTHAAEQAAAADQAARRAAAARAHEAARRAALGAQRRERQRVALQAAVDLGSDSNLFTGFSSDIQEGGVFVATVQALPRGTPVDVTLTLPQGHSVQASGVVRWTRELNERQPEMMPGLGVQFTALLPEVTDALRRFLSLREPLFFPV